MAITHIPETVDVSTIAAGDTNIGNVDVLTLPALVAGTANIGDVDVLTLPALVAGSANIGDVDVLTIAAGDNNIGNVDIVTLPALVTGSANIGDVDIVGGTVADDATTPGAPVMIGGQAKNFDGTDTPITGPLTARERPQLVLATA